MNNNLNTLHNTAKDAAFEAGKVVLSYAENGFSIDEKSPANLVTEADIQT